MTKNQLKEIIVDQKSKFLAPQHLVPRRLLKELIDDLPHPEIAIITGVRRSGKSCLLKLVCDELLVHNGVSAGQIFYINFEDERFTGFSYTDYDLLLQCYFELYNPGNRIYFFLDEIQQADGWSRWLNRLLEFGSHKIFITGSIASLLTPEIAQHLTGRNRQFLNWPMSFAEVLALRSMVYSGSDIYQLPVRAALHNAFEDYLKIGGFPEVVKQNAPDLSMQYYRDILYRDIVARHAIRHIRELKEIGLFLMSNPATIHSYQSIKKAINARNTTTIKNYLDVFEEVFLIFRLPLYDHSVRRQMGNPSKYFLVDTGLSHSVGFGFSENRGLLEENVVFLQLLRLKYDVYYWKSQDGKEVDFVVREGRRISQAIQVCDGWENAKTRDREIKALMAAVPELSPDKLLILTNEHEERLQIQGSDITVLPMIQWLLDNV